MIFVILMSFRIIFAVLLTFKKQEKMKKILLIAIVALFSIDNAEAQLPDGSVAPDFTLTDVHGVTHNLYTYLDSGYTVIVDFYAVWCSPCWAYKNTGAMENLYTQHGPAGYPDVDSNTTDDVMVFAVEADGNAVACMYGTGCNTVGDWITGCPFPQISTDGSANTQAINTAYSIAYFPTIYMICPDRIIREIGQSTNPYAYVATCPAPASFNNDIRSFDYIGETLTCEGGLTPEIKIQNYGLTPLTSATIEVFVNGVSDTIIQWAGNLLTYDTDDITLPALIGLTGNEAITIEVTNPNGGVDNDPSNNQTIAFNVVMATQNTSTNVTVQIVTDAYGSETRWSIKTSSGLTVANGGPYNDLGSAGTTTQTPITTSLNPNECHTFTITDSYGDGINAGYGAGSYTVTDGNGTILGSGGSFADEESSQFKTGNLSSIDNNSIANNISIYPNPTNDIANITFSTTERSNAQLNITNVIGEVVYSNNIGMLSEGQHFMPITTSGISEGIYFVNLIINDKVITNKITIIK